MSLRNQNLLTEEEWSNWLHSIAIVEDIPHPQYDILVQRAFLSLYFRVLETEGSTAFTDDILETLKGCVGIKNTFSKKKYIKPLPPNHTNKMCWR